MRKRENMSGCGSQSLRILLERWRAGTFGELLEDWKWILDYTKRYRWAVLCYTLLGIVSASLSLISAVASKYTIDIITGYQTSRLGSVAAVMIGSAVVSLTFRSLTSRVSAKISINVTNDMQAAVFERILSADWAALGAYANGDILNRFNSDITTVAANAVSWLPNLLIGLYTFAATFGVIWHYDRNMALIALTSAPVLLLVSRRLLRKLHRCTQEVKEQGSRLMTFETETFYNLDTIKSFDLTASRSAQLRHWQERFRQASLNYNLLGIQTEAALSALNSGVQLIAFGYCLYLLWSGRIVYGTMTLFLTQSGKLSSTFSNLAGVVPAFLSSAVSARRIRELTQLEAEPRLTGCGALTDNASGGVEVRMEQVSFGYRDRETVLRDSEFRAGPGEIVALIGPSGEGKTTMIRLMLGLVRPQSGQVLLQNAAGVRVPANAETRRCFSYVPQGNTLLSGTVAENLRMGKEDATDEELEQALRIACAWDFVSRMPQGLESCLGERGRGLSEGQTQRLAIARAVLRDAPVLLLDEATSALDTETERQVLQNILCHAPDKTCIVTTHRPSVLNLCSRVYRVMDGQLRELDRKESARMAMDF